MARSSAQDGDKTVSLLRDHIRLKHLDECNDRVIFANRVQDFFMIESKERTLYLKHREILNKRFAGISFSLITSLIIISFSFLAYYRSFVRITLW